jgi:inhibitor of cysteine peptidase
MKRILLIIILCSILVIPQSLAAGSQSTQSTGVSLLLNGKPLKLDAQTIVKNGVTYVPMRSMLTELGATVLWDAKTGIVTAAHHQTTVKLKADDASGWKNGKSIHIEHPAQLIGGRMYVSLRWMNESFGAVVKWHAATRTAAVYYPDQDLPRVGSYEHLKSLISDITSSYNYTTTMMTDGTAVRATAETESKASEAAAPSADAASGGSDYSSTNIQVQGVDESDVVKSDGTYIYQVINQKIVITRAYPADQMTIVSTLPFAGSDFTPLELYVADDQLIVIGSNYANLSSEVDTMPMVEEKRIMSYPAVPAINSTKAILFDITNRTEPKQIREAEIEGSYLSSRKIGTSLYMVSNKYMDYYYIMNEQDEAPAPMYKDSITSDKMLPLSYDEIRYFPGSIEPNYMLVGGLNLDDPTQPMDVKAYLGSGQNIFASTEHLYVAVTQYEKITDEPVSGTKTVEPALETKTTIYKFALFQGSITYMAEGVAPGTILNQFSMDEHNGYFRIATTTGNMWRSDEFTSKNNLYVLDESMAIRGKVEDIAPGERIYSVRFIGDRAYMVTFKSVDPLFVIDVSDPANPHILGALKIPGYSDYLHPYDENHIIGFGKDTTELANKDENGNVINTTAYYLGMKVAMFDVSDVAQPKELHKMIIGDRGTHSELLYNHKALLFSKAKNLMAFPVELYEINSANSGVKDPELSELPVLEYGQFTYQGAYVYNIDIINGFTLKGRITHLSDEELNQAGQNWYDGDKNVRRILYIDETLYTLSNSMIKANAISDLKSVGSLSIPK